MEGWVQVLMIAGMLSGCASHKAPPMTILTAQSGTSTKVAPYMDEGDRPFQANDLVVVGQAYQSAVGIPRDLAEAHDTVAVILDRMGNGDEAKKYYVTAANLAPVRKVFWESPPFRESGLNDNLRRKSHLDLAFGTRF